jgi:hypothetical protein
MHEKDIWSWWAAKKLARRLDDGRSVNESRPSVASERTDPPCLAWFLYG